MTGCTGGVHRGRFIEDPIDNPDQRIQLDIDAFTTRNRAGPQTPTVGTTTTLLFGGINAMVSVVAFTPILWNLSGPLSVFGVTLNHALFWIALLYVFATTVIAFWIGRPLIRFSFRNELTNAAFRYAWSASVMRPSQSLSIAAGVPKIRFYISDSWRYRQLSALRGAQPRAARLEPGHNPDHQPPATGGAGPNDCSRARSPLAM